MGGDEVNAFLTHLAVSENVAASTQNQAFSAVLFLYREVLQQDLDLNLDAVRTKKPRHLHSAYSRRSTGSITANGRRFPTGSKITLWKWLKAE